MAPTMPAYRRRRLWVSPAAARYYPYQLWSDRADVLLTIGRWDEVEADLRRNLEQARAAGDEPLVADAKYKLARIVFNRGDLAGARALYLEARDTFTRLDDRAGIARVCGVVGIVETMLGRYDVALEYFERGLGLLRQIGDRRNEGNILNGIGNVHGYRGDFAAAREYYRQKLAISTEQDDRDGIGRALGNIGVTYA
ncbi:tetratricopeptide repeat protein, partial [bacterium]|nr:tetratricopeptide repeat protein [bacterium]